jgi:uncharacterized protein (TIGR04255 family)
MSALPFPIPARLPRKITPCPIVEAVMEIRFVPNRPWEHFPGLISEKFGSKFKGEEDTGVSQIPLVIRERDPRLTYLPFRRLIGEKYLLQFGPSIISLATKRNAYPGWDSFWGEMSELLNGLREMDIIRETNRLGLRYVNFFPFDIFEQLSLSINVGDTIIRNPETGFNSIFYHDGFRHLVQINNASLVMLSEDKPSFGSILDIDTTVAANSTEAFSQAAELFKRAHLSEKSMFFGLLNPDYLAKLSPEY